MSFGTLSTLEIASLISLVAEIEITPSCQTNGSSFHKSDKVGFGYLPTYTGFDPTHDWENSLTRCFVPSPDEVDVTSPMILEIEQVAFQYYGETIVHGVEKQFLKYCGLNVPTINSPGQTRMKTRGIVEGIVSNSSYEDAYLQIGDRYLAVIEFKGPGTAIYATVAQAAAYGTNYAITLLNKGLPPEYCIVPVIASNGVTIIFGATIILQNTYPTYIPISKHLDLSNSYESKIAAAFLQRIASHCKFIEEKIKGPLPTPITQMELQINDELWVKTINHVVYECGLGLFHTDDTDPHFLGSGLRHMFTVLNRVYNHLPSRPFAEYPISIRTPDKRAIGETTHSRDNKSFYQLIYRNLSKSGYKIGTPNPFLQEGVFDKFVIALKYAVSQIHEAGVIHCDLYLSNVMWKYVPSTQTVDIKIIDWDCSHTLDEGHFHPNIESRLKSYLRREPTFGVEHDLQYLKIFELPKNQYVDDWTYLASNEKAEVDQAFRNLFMSVLDS